MNMGRLWNVAEERLQYIEKELSYDCGLIWKNLLRTQNQADIKKRMQLNFVLSSRIVKNKNRKKLRLALIVHIYYEDLAEYCRKYAESMPEGTDVYVTVPDAKKLEIVKQAFQSYGISARGYHRIIKVARTIADIEECEVIQTEHISEAICYRSLDKNLWMKG